jgi:hypothetical protein
MRCIHGGGEEQAMPKRRIPIVSKKINPVSILILDELLGWITSNILATGPDAEGSQYQQSDKYPKILSIRPFIESPSSFSRRA